MTADQAERLVKALEALIVRLQSGPLFVIAVQPPSLMAPPVPPPAHYGQGVGIPPDWTRSHWMRSLG